MNRNDESSESTALDVVGSVTESEIILDAVPVDDGTLDLISIKQLTGKKVWESRGEANSGSLKRLGRVLAFVFHPHVNKCIGFLVKRPDAALMFRRKDLFVSFSGFDISGERIVVGNSASDKGKGAFKAAGVNLEECVLWLGMPAVCEDGTVLGTVGDVLCELGSGDVYSISISNGATATALLGTLRIPSDEILGFCVCEELGDSGAAGATGAAGAGVRGSAGTRRSARAGAPKDFPAILVKDAAKERPTEGGVAEKAGAATAVVTHNAKKAIDKVKPKAKETTAFAGEAVNKGAYIAGRQIGRTNGMFKAFKEEFDKALHDDSEDE